MILPRFALRNLTRHTRRSVLLMVAMAGGLLVLVLLKAMQDGFVAQRLEQGLGMSLGHLRIRGAEAPLAETDALLALLEDTEGVVSAAPRVRLTAMLRAVDATAGAVVLGVDPHRETATTRLPGTLVAGAFLPETTATGLPPIVLGATLAERLALGPGDRVSLLGESRRGPLVADMFEVSGLFRTGGTTTDATLAYVRLTDTRAFGTAPGEAGEIVLRLHEPARSPELARRLAERPEFADLIVEDWPRMAPELLGLMETLRVQERVRSVIVFALVAMGIFSTITLSIYERRREFGVLMAMGMRAGAVFRLLLVEVLLLALGGIALGAALSVALVAGWLGPHGIDFSKLGANLPGALEGTAVVYPLLRTETVVTAGLWVLATSLLVLVVPAWRVLARDPAAALRDAA